MVAHSLWLLTINHSIFWWNLIESWEIWLHGPLFYRNKILI
jgi:hypothetical protein